MLTIFWSQTLIPVRKHSGSDFGFTKMQLLSERYLFPTWREKMLLRKYFYSYRILLIFCSRSFFFHLFFLPLCLFRLFFLTWIYSVPNMRTAVLAPSICLCHLSLGEKLFLPCSCTDPSPYADLKSFWECSYACVLEGTKGNSNHKQTPKKEQECHSHTVFPLSAFPASKYLQLREFPALMALITTWGQKVLWSWLWLLRSTDLPVLGSTLSRTCLELL